MQKVKRRKEKKQVREKNQIESKERTESKSLPHYSFVKPPHVSTGNLHLPTLYFSSILLLLKILKRKTN